jgi:hypothetical protein
MKYQKPEVVLNGTAISAIEAGLFKDQSDEDSNNNQTDAAYRSDE